MNARNERQPACLEADPYRPRMECKCGKCCECRENARWERIYQAKFADPHYYDVRSALRMASPVAGF